MAKKAELNAPPQTNANSEVLVNYVKVIEGNRSPQSGGSTSPQSVESLLFTSGK